MRHPLAAVLAALVLALEVRALPNPSNDRISDDALRIRGIFDSQLPGTERRHDLRLIFHPSLGDLSPNRDDLRTEIGARYGVSDRWELTAKAETFFAHGLGEVPLFDEGGVSRLIVGTKYRVGKKLWPGWDTAFGGGYGLPVGHPPREITDGLERISGYVTFARPVQSMPGLRVFWGVGTDFVTNTGIPGTRRRNEIARDNANIRGGWVWERGAVNYTFEAAYTTSRLYEHVVRDSVMIRPGFVLQVPTRFTFHSSTQWLWGLAFPTTFGHDGTNFGITGKLRTNIDFKRMFRRGSRENGPQ